MEIGFLFIATADYIPIDQPLEFSTAPAQMCVEITITPDAVVETDETFSVSLSSSDPAVVIVTNTTVTIVDDNDSKFIQEAILLK